MGSSFNPARKLFVRLDPNDLERLRQRARSERRHPSDEAALLLSEALKRRDENDGAAHGCPS
ncbi:MAG: Arc family DNA binding domain-containing protein [Chloroflexota bacterium]|nr:MAG: Arc family DNA binding domain-containing protein [Chloroflexota bacterium]